MTVIDAKEQVLGRLCTHVAKRLLSGEEITIVNAEKVRLTGNKLKGKLYYHHSGYPGGIRAVTAEKLLASRPEELLRRAVKGMLPKNRLGRRIVKKLKVYAGPDHPHAAQQPEQIQV